MSVLSSGVSFQRLLTSHDVLAAAWSLIGSEILIWLLAYYFTRVTITHIPSWPSVFQPLVSGGDSKIVTQVRSMFVRQR